MRKPASAARNGCPNLPEIEGRYTLVEPDGEDSEWRVKLVSPKVDVSKEWRLKEVTEGRLKVIDGGRGSKNVYTRVDENPAAESKK